MAKKEIQPATHICDRCGKDAGDGGTYFSEEGTLCHWRKFRVKQKQFFEMCDECFNEVINFIERK